MIKMNIHFKYLKSNPNFIAIIQVHHQINSL